MGVSLRIKEFGGGKMVAGQKGRRAEDQCETRSSLAATTKENRFSNLLED